MKKIILALAFLVLVSNTAFAANPWSCTKVSTANQGDSLDVTMSCTNGVGNPIVLTRPVFRPSRKADVKNAMRNVAIELRDKTKAIADASAVQAVVDADASIVAVETDPTV